MRMYRGQTFVRVCVVCRKNHQVILVFTSAIFTTSTNPVSQVQAPCDPQSVSYGACEAYSETHDVNE